ncbi:hypothetical protein Syn8016DRAFT_2992, partial [Synechococcus sp. WH 8016]
QLLSPHLWLSKHLQSVDLEPLKSYRSTELESPLPKGGGFFVPGFYGWFFGLEGER